jgi:FMN phosphatase YigB (HAD superfamily)
MIPIVPQNIEAILFDLDGTLLEIEMQKYIPAYAGYLAASLQSEVEPGKTINGIFSAINALINRPSGHVTNESYFFQHIADQLNLDINLIRSSFINRFSQDLTFLDPLMQPMPLTRELICQCTIRDITIVIATNPVFPRVVIESRLARAGLTDVGFNLVTSYENCCCCKPNPDYFSSILTLLDLPASACLMVGNDSGHDLAARKVGIPTFLIDTWLIDRCHGDFMTELRGDHRALLDFIMAIDKLR